MKISTVLIDDNPIVCLDIDDRLYSVLKAQDLILKSADKDLVSGFEVPIDFQKNFLKMRHVEDFLNVIEEYLLSLIEMKKDEHKAAELKAGSFDYASPIHECPLFFGAIQNSPEFWRRNRRDRIDLMFFSGFARSFGAMTAHMEMINIPEYTTSFRCAAELGVVIGKDGKNIPEDNAMDHVFGYTCVNDMIGNCWQKIAKERHPAKTPSRFELLVNSYYGRCTENFGPVGPNITTKDQVPDPYNLIMLTKKSGKVKDRAHSNAMLIGIERGIHLLSQYVPLKAGSIVHMGSMGCDGITINEHDPLTDLDYIEIDIEKLGALRNYFVDHRFDNKE